MLLTDVVVSHPMTAFRVQRQVLSTTSAQYGKQTKYSKMASQLGAELLPFSVATYGGLADDAMKLVQAMGEEGEEAMGTWTKGEIVRYTLSMTAIAVQRGNACLFTMVWRRLASGTNFTQQTHPTCSPSDTLLYFFSIMVFSLSHFCAFIDCIRPASMTRALPR